jgi:hypothetical protein
MALRYPVIGSRRHRITEKSGSFLLLRYFMVERIIAVGISITSTGVNNLLLEAVLIVEASVNQPPSSWKFSGIK